MHGGIAFNKRPFVAIAIGIIIGILIGKILSSAPFSFAVCFCLLAVGFICQLFNKKIVAVLILAVALGLLRVAIAYPTYDIPPGTYGLTGRVATQTEKNGTGFSVVIDNAKLNGVTISGRLMLLYEDRITYGDIIDVNVSVVTLSVSEEFDERHFYLKEGIVAKAYALDDIEVIGHDSSGEWIINIRNSITSGIDALFDENAGLIRGMILGDDSKIPNQTLSAYRNTGIAHILAISGLHVGILAGALMLLLRRLKPWISVLCLFVLLLLYCMITAFPASLCRASIMILCLAFAPLLERRYDTLSAIGVSMVIILLINPFELYGMGFQLSYSAVVAIALLYKPLVRAFSKAPKQISSTVSVSLSATIGTFGPLVHYTGSISALSMIANVLVAPFIAVIIIPALIAALIYSLSPTIASVVAFVPNVVSSVITGAVTLLGSMPFATIEVAKPPQWWTALLFVPMVFFSDYAIADKKLKYSVGCIFLICLFILLLAAFA